MSKTWIDEVEVRLRDASPGKWLWDALTGEVYTTHEGQESVVAVVSCPDDGGLIEYAPADLRRLLRVARAAAEARERIGDVALADGVFAEHGSGPEGQRVLAEVWRALDVLDDALSGEEST